MLTLSRNIGESLLIGDDIEIYVVNVRGRRARLAIRAPRHITVLRKELRAADAVGTPDDGQHQA